MFAIHYFEKNIAVLSQCSSRIPKVEETIKIKGRKGKVLDVSQIEENKYHVHVDLEKKVKNAPILKDDKKKKR